MASFKKRNWKSSREDRRTRAFDLASERATRTDKQQRALLRSRPGESKKETTRLLNRPTKAKKGKK